MKISQSFRFLVALAGGLLLSAITLPASPIIPGSILSFSGTIDVVGSTAINWTYPPPETAHVGATVTGSFASSAGSLISIYDLTNPPATPGVSFSPQLFISFPVASGLPDLNIDYIFVATDNPGDCSAGTPAPGQVCSAPGSPFDFKNTVGGGSTATWVFTGLSVDNSARWTGTFTSQFTIPFQQVFANLASNGHVSNDYSATLSFVAAPEPNTILFAFGALGVFVGCWRKKRMAA